MRTHKLRVAIDMDEVIADAHAEHAAWYMSNFGYDWKSEDLRDSSLRALVSQEHHEKLEERLHRGEGFINYDVIPGSQAALATLSEKFDIFITTAAMEYPASCAPKFAWLRKNFPSISPMNIVFCGDKSIIATDYLIDDNQKHFERFQGQGVLFSAPHNASEDYPLRVSGWEDAVALLNSKILTSEVAPNRPLDRSQQVATSASVHLPLRSGRAEILKSFGRREAYESLG